VHVINIDNINNSKMSFSDNILSYLTLVDLYYLQDKDNKHKMAFDNLWMMGKYTNDGLYVAILDDNVREFDEIFNFVTGNPEVISKLIYTNKSINVLEWILRDVILKNVIDARTFSPVARHKMCDVCDKKKDKDEILGEILEHLARLVDQAIRDEKWEDISFIDHDHYIVALQAIGNDQKRI